MPSRGAGGRFDGRQSRLGFGHPGTLRIASRQSACDVSFCQQTPPAMLAFQRNPARIVACVGYFV
jgi:hypothetical protein